MNLQKDLIQHIVVLTVAPGYLNFSEPRSSEILRVGLEETKLLLRDCLGILAVEDTAGGEDIFQTIQTSAGAPAVLGRYARTFREASERIDGIRGARWEDDLDARSAIEPVVSDLDGFLGGEHWYDVEQARLIRRADGWFYQNCSKVCLNFISNWHCASLLFSDEAVECVLGQLRERFGIEGDVVPVSEFDPPNDYLWRARTYAPQTPQSLINYWAAMLPGARRMRIKQLVDWRAQV